MNWVCKSFDELTTRELYTILRLRQEVFAVEQNCVYQDCDDVDLSSSHLLGLFEEEGKQVLVAYARLVPQNGRYSEQSIGRVVTSNKHRRMGFGQQLMRRCVC